MLLHNTPCAGILSVSKRFGSYGPQSESKIRQLHVKEDPCLKRFARIWKRFEIMPECTGWGLKDEYSIEKTYGIIGRGSRGQRFTSEEIGRIVAASAPLLTAWNHSLKTGLLISWLINHGDDSEYALMMGHLESGIRAIGAWNTKRLVLEGDSDSYLGYCMKSGEIVLKGNATGDWSAGMGMTGGRIIIEGTAEDIVGQEGGEIMVLGKGISSATLQIGGTTTIMHDAWSVGDQMKGGTIICHGDVLGKAGELMEGGEIHVDGEIESIGRILHGRIYHRRKLIVDK